MFLLIYIESDIYKPMPTEDDLFSVLSHDTRRRLLLLLEGFGELCVCDLVAGVDLPQAVVSRHLAVLRAAELVVARKRGTWVYYKRRPSLAPWVADIIAVLRAGPGAEAFARDARRVKALQAQGAVCCEPHDRSNLL